MPKFYSCSVPSCHIWGPIQNFFSFPLDLRSRQAWMAAIPDLDEVIDHTSVVCKKHFVLGPNQALDQPADQAYLIPTIFEDHTEDVEKKKYFPRYMFHLTDRDVAPDTFGDCESSDVVDFIIEFCFLQAYYNVRLGDLMNKWQVSFTETQAYFYKLSLDNMAKIKYSVKIDKNLQVEIAAGGRKMDPLDLTWVLPATSKITRWSQLRAILFEYGGAYRVGNK
ncbi:unnamed protein product [Phaedon cochleariae]|uniref:THAP-type domain-containing protein n=1 Tax=Phaedon cochleariae TaxID=80249 RepID=A0A9P0DLW2_PHACE|nr:unnamed protein product [Phaedon cochleariae]